MCGRQCPLNTDGSVHGHEHRQKKRTRVSMDSPSLTADLSQCEMILCLQIIPKFSLRIFRNFQKKSLFQLTFDTFSFEIDGTRDFNRKKPVLIDCIRRLSFELAISRRVFLSRAFLSPSPLLLIWTRDERLLNSCMSCIVAIPPTRPALICFSRKSSLLFFNISVKV